MLLEGVNGQLALRADVRSEDDHQRKLKHPKVVFGLLPDSTSHGDILVKLLQYQSLPSVDTIVIIDPERWLFATVERNRDLWVRTDHLSGASLTLRDPAITLSWESIFRWIGPPRAAANPLAAGPGQGGTDTGID